MLCLWQARSQAMELPPKTAGQGGERRPWPEPRSGSQASAAAAAAIDKRSAHRTRSKATGMDPACATLTAGASGYKTASKTVITGTEPAAPATSMRKDDNYVYIPLPRHKVAPVDTGRTETVQHHVSQSAGPKNAAPVLQSAPVQLPAPASQQWLGDSGTIS